MCDDDMLYVYRLLPGPGHRRDPNGLCSMHLKMAWAIREAETRACLSKTGGVYAVFDSRDTRVYTAHADITAPPVPVGSEPRESWLALLKRYLWG